MGENGENEKKIFFLHSFFMFGNLFPAPLARTRGLLLSSHCLADCPLVLCFVLGEEVCTGVESGKPGT